MNSPSEHWSSANVVIANGGHPISIHPDRVYFAFPSGRLGYDCVSCGAQCCRGHGFEVRVGREFQHQLATSHPVRFFLDPCGSGATDHFHARNLQPACFFLDAQNFCSIQVEQGYVAKPETCRLFPFNNITRAGDYLIIAPHSGLCPLSVLPAGERSDASDHDQLFAAMSASGIGTHVPQVAAAKAAVPALIALERRIVECSEQDLRATRYAGNAAAQLALTRLAGGAATAPAEDVRERARDDVEDFLWMLYDVLGVPQPIGDDKDQALVRTMVGMTPSLRARLVFDQGAASEPGGVERIPYLLLALHTLATFAREAGMAQVTYQSVMGLLDGYRPLLTLLASLDRVMAWKPEADVDFAMTSDKSLRSRYIGVAKALLPGAQRKAPAPLGRILSGHVASEGIDRVLFLKVLARRLQGQIEPMTGAPAARSSLRRPRVAIQQWALGYFSTDFLMIVADSRARRAGGG